LFWLQAAAYAVTHELSYNAATAGMISCPNDSSGEISCMLGMLNQVLNARLAQVPAHPDYVMGAHALWTEVDCAQGRPLYLLVVPPHVLTVAL
jgi:hypothetical protein